jgi:hypothetical protein
MPYFETGYAVAAAQPSGIDRRPVSLLLGLFLAGVVAGLVELLTDQDKTSTGASVAAANWVHAGLAVALAAAFIAGYLRDRRKLMTFLVRPFTHAGWASLLNGLLSLPLLIWELAMSASAQPARVTSMEAWRARHVLGIKHSQDRHPPTVPARRVVAGAPLMVLASVAAVALLLVTLRAGEQVFAVFDADFTRDAWGGPTYLGASLAHWLDGIYIFYACTVVLSAAATRASRFPEVRHRSGSALTTAGRN